MVEDREMSLLDHQTVHDRHQAKSLVGRRAALSLIPLLANTTGVHREKQHLFPFDFSSPVPAMVLKGNDGVIASRCRQRIPQRLTDAVDDYRQPGSLRG